MLKLVGIGALGNMLSPAAVHLPKNNDIARFLRILDRLQPSPEKQKRREEWVAHGALPVTTYDQLIGDSDIDGIVICAGKNGDDLCIIAALIAQIEQHYATKDRPFILHCSTLSVEFVQKVHQVCHEQHIQYVNYPLTGGTKGAKEATMLILASGEKKLYERLSPLLSLLGKPKYFDEHPDTAAKVKLIGHVLVYNGLLGITSAVALQEQSIQGEAESQASFFDFLNQGAGGTKQWDVALKAAVAEDSWHTGFLLPHAAVDAIYTADLLIKSKLPLISIWSILNVAGCFSFLLQEESANNLATQTILQIFRKKRRELDEFINSKFDYDPEKYLGKVTSSLPANIQKKVKLNIEFADLLQFSKSAL